MLGNGVLVTILIICVITDLKNRKIYNKVTFPGVVMAFIINLMQGGALGVAYSLAGFLVGFGLLLIPYLLGGMGAGDVKLLALVGAFKGMTFVLLTSIYMALIGGVIALVLLLLRKRVREILKRTLLSILLLRYGMKTFPASETDARTATYPYGVAIAGGAVLSLWLRGWGIL